MIKRLKIFSMYMAIITLIGALCVFSASIVWIYYGWDTAWRLGVSGIITYHVFYSVVTATDKLIKKHEKRDNPLKDRIKNKLNEKIS